MVRLLELAGIGVAFIVITVILSLSSQILGSVQSNQLTLTPINTINESNNFAVTNPYQVDQANDTSFAGGLSVTSIQNVSFVIGAGNYTAYGNGTIFFLGSSTIRNVTYNITYIIQDNTFNAAYNITGQGLTAFNTFASYLNTLAIVIIASVIIGMLITYLVLRLFSQGQMGAWVDFRKEISIEF